jgi:TonB-linked SusC/RagA family outer membrane protein
MKNLQRLFFLNLLFLVFFASGMSAQESVSGKVTDNFEEPLPGVTVVIKGTSRGTITNSDGFYSLELTPDAEALVFSFIGMKNQEVTLNGQTTIDVVLESDIIGLEEVVAVGYGTSRKVDLTGSVSTVSTEGFDRVPATNPLQAIQGKASGVQITSGSGMPGEPGEVLIRGVQSINGTSSPVYVVDGMITNSINNINPNNIESVSVLKDASAAAIYGARAANGVVIVTTKRGTASQKPEITFNTYYGIQTESNLQVEMLNADQFLQLWTESYTNDDIDIPWSDEELAAYSGVDTDWKDLMMQTGTIQNYDVSVAGGSEKSKFFLSASHLDQKGMIIETGYTKSTFALNTDHQINDWLKVGNSLNLYRYKQEGEGGSQSPYNYALLKTPITLAYEENGDYGEIRNTDLEHMHQNPIWMAKESEHSRIGKGLQGNIYMTLNLFDGLTFTTRGSLDYGNVYRTSFTPGVSPNYGWEGSSINSIEKEFRETVNWIGDFLLNYETTLNENHSINALLGYSVEESVFENLFASRTGTPNNDIRFLAAGDPQSQLNDNTYSDWSFASLFGRVNYNFKNKYLLGATLRRDGTSRLTEDNRYGVFPSASAAWRISEEAFMRDIDVIDDLKLRASIGTLGNILSVGNYATSASLTARKAVLNQGGALGYTLTDAINEDLRWEEAQKKNFGIDVTAFRNKVYSNFDYFIEDTYDLLFRDPVANSTGLSGSPLINAGQIRNSGFEFLLGYRQQRGDWTYDASFNISHVKNEVIDLEGRDLRTSGLVEGEPVNSFFGYKSDGIIYNENELGVYEEGAFTGKRVGDIALLDIDGYDEDGNLTGIADGKVDAADRTIIGNRYPDLTYGAFATVGYKNWSFQVQLQGVQGVDKYFGNTGAYSLIQLMSSWARNEDARILNRYHATNNPNGTWPMLSKNQSGKNLEDSDFWLADASYLRVNNVNLNYDFPETVLNTIGMSKLALYISVQNAYTFTSYDGPEVDTTADPLTGVPQPRTWTLGLKATF